MTWKDRLRAFRSAVTETQQIKNQLGTLEARIYTPKAQHFTSMPHGSSGAGKTLDDLAITHLELLDKYRSRLAAVEHEQIIIEDALEVLTPEQRMVVRYYYFDLMKWEDVCNHVHYGWAQTHRIHAQALKTLDAAVE